MDDHAAAWRRIAADEDGVCLAAAARACVADLEVDCLGLSLVVAGELRFMAHATDERARRLEDAQLTTGEGPCGPQGYPPSVHMAAGVLAEMFRLPPDDALARMRAHAFRHGQPLHQTADHVLTHHTLD